VIPGGNEDLLTGLEGATGGPSGTNKK
jgi:hypothetical protein